MVHFETTSTVNFKALIIDFFGDMKGAKRLKKTRNHEEKSWGTICQQSKRNKARNKLKDPNSTV